MSTTHRISFDQYCISHKTISYQAALPRPGLKSAVSASWPNF